MVCTGPHLELLSQLAGAANGTQLITDHQLAHGDMEALCLMMEATTRCRHRAMPASWLHRIDSVR